MKMFATLLLGVFVWLPLHAEEKIIVRLKMSEYGITSRMISPEIDVAGQNLKNKTIDLVVNQEQYENLQLNGYEVEVVSTSQRARPDDRYLTYSEIIQMIKELLDQYPDIVYVKEIGKSLQGRRIYAVRLSTKDNLDAKPSILFNGMHHAREIMTTEVTTDIMNFLAKNYGSDDMPQVTDWLEHLQIWIIPQLNPDGNNIVWNSDNMWRKNARGDDSDIWGVDLNRNYNFQWNYCNGSSGSKGSQTYRGTEAGSEPETQAIMNFVKEINATIDVSYHSYSELVLSPYGCQGQYTPENFIFKSLGQDFAKRLVTDSGKGTYTYGTGWETLYSTDGEDISWMYNEVNTLAYVVEMNADSQGFQPSYDKWRNITVERQRKGWQFLLNRLMGGSQLRGRVVNAETGELIEAGVRIKGLDYKYQEKPRRAKRGYFHKVLVPGDFEIEFSAPGFESEVVAVSIDEGVTEMDVALNPSTAWETW